MFGVAIYIALKLAIKSKYFLQEIIINFHKPQFQTAPTKNPEKNDEKIATFWAQILLKMSF